MVTDPWSVISRGRELLSLYITSEGYITTEMALKRIQRELQELGRDPPANCSAGRSILSIDKLH